MTQGRYNQVVERICPYCKIAFFTDKPSMLFCSKQCKRGKEIRTESKECLDCGTLITNHASRCYDCSRKLLDFPAWSKGQKKEDNPSIMNISIKMKGKKKTFSSIEKRTKTRIENGFWKNPGITCNKMSKSRTGEKHYFWKGGRGKFTYGYCDDWDKIRLLIYIRDKFTCQDCGIGGANLDVHHIIPFFDSFDNSLNNLIALCKSCHKKRDLKIVREKKLLQTQLNNFRRIAP